MNKFNLLIGISLILLTACNSNDYQNLVGVYTLGKNIKNDEYHNTKPHYAILIIKDDGTFAIKRSRQNNEIMKVGSWRVVSQRYDIDGKKITNVEFLLLDKKITGKHSGTNRFRYDFLDPNDFNKGLYRMSSFVQDDCEVVSDWDLICKYPEEFIFYHP